MEYIETRDGVKLPRVGFGTAQIRLDSANTERVVREGIEAGFRFFDFAQFYGNQVEMGKAFENIFSEGKYKREDFIFLGKLWNTHHSPEHVEEHLQQTLKDLRTPYLDFYLMHWPVSWEHKWQCSPMGEQTTFTSVPLHETWAAMERLVEKKLVRHLGVSNYTPMLLHDLLSYAKVKPSILEAELHPFLQQTDLVEYCKSQKVVVIAYSPLARPFQTREGHQITLTNPTVVKIATAHNKSPSQICLKWNLQRNNNVIVIPKTSTQARMVENFNLWGFELTAEEMEEMKSVNQNYRMFNPKWLDGFCVF